MSVLTCRAEPLLRPVVYGQVSVYRYTVIFQGQMRRLVMFMVGATQSHGRQKVKTDLPVWFWILNRCAVLGWLELIRVRTFPSFEEGF